MTAAGATSFLLLLGTFGCAAFFVFYLRPSIACSRTGLRAVRLHYRVMDAIADNTLDPDDPVVRRARDFTRALADDPSTFGRSQALALHGALKKVGAGRVSSVFAQPTHGNLPAEGRRVLHDVERELKDVLADHYVHASRMWWWWVPVRYIYRRRAGNPLGKGHPTHPDHTHARTKTPLLDRRPALPGDLADDTVRAGTEVARDGLVHPRGPRSPLTAH
jgi:hypothetical protein